MKPRLTTSALAAIFGLTLAVCFYSPASTAASINGMDTDMDMGSGMMDMDLGPADAEYDLHFIDSITVHHQGAIDMAEDALSKSQRSEIQQLSEDVIDTQSREITQLQQWRLAWYPNAGSPMDMDSGMMGVDLGPADAEYDLRFIDTLTVHHQDAIEMAEDALSKSQRSEIQQLSEDIIDTQSGEITQLQEWRQAWYPDAGPVAAVPEPSATLGILAFGAFGIATVLKRKRKGSQ